MKRRRREERAPLSVEEADALMAQLEASIAAVAKVHGRERAERASRAVRLAIQLHIVQARRAWREEAERRAERAVLAFYEALDGEHEAEQTLLTIAAAYTGRKAPCLAPRRRRCDSASMRWFTPYARCVPARCATKGDNDDDSDF